MKYTITFESDLPIQPVDLEFGARYAIGWRFARLNDETRRRNRELYMSLLAKEIEQASIQFGAVCELCGAEPDGPQGEMAQQVEYTVDRGVSWYKIWLCERHRHNNSDDIEVREIK